MEITCGFCGKRTLSLRRCSVCQQVQYCSKACQREDWKDGHRSKCEKMQRPKKEADVKRNDARVLRDPDRGKVLYESGSVHQYDDIFEMQKPGSWFYARDNFSNSRLICHDTNIKYNDNKKEASMATTNKKCEVCGRSDDTVKSCSRCKTTNYCSKHCQRKDWRNHKFKCLQPGEEVDDTISTEGYKQEEGFAASSGSDPTGSLIQAFESLNFKQRPFFKTVDQSYIAHMIPGDMDKAKSLTWEAFPKCTIIDYLREIPHEFFGIRPRGTGNVAVGFISRYHGYVVRHCIYLQDKDGDEVYVGFYLDQDNPLPYFQWKDVVPGNYMCIEDPYIHPFLDGTVGIRVDIPSAVRVFSFK